MTQKTQVKNKRKTIADGRKIKLISKKTAAYRKKTISVTLRPMMPTEYSQEERRELKMFERNIMAALK